MPTPDCLCRLSARSRSGKVVRAVLCAFLLAGIAAPAAARDYRIELVLFEHLTNRPHGNGDYWLPSPRSAVTLDSDRALTEGFETYTGELDLADDADRMASSGAYRVLRHIAWQQPGLADNEAISVRIALGSPIPLWVSSAPDTEENFIPASAEPRPTRTQEVTTFDVNGTVRVRLGRFLHLESRLIFTDLDEGRSYRLLEIRKMRSRELHYVDNPRFGILTRIVPIEETDNDEAVTEEARLEAADAETLLEDADAAADDAAESTETNL